MRGQSSRGRERAEMALDRVLLVLAQELRETASSGEGPRTVPCVAGGRDSRGRFTTDVSFHELLDRTGFVAAAAAAAKGEGASPLAVSKAEFDRALAGETLFDCVSAEAVRKRLGVPWPLVLQLAVLDPSKRSHLLSTQAGLRRPQFAGGDAEILRALRAAAFAHGRTPTPRDYDLISLGLVVERRAKGLALELPQSTVMVRRFGSWAAAVEAAGLEPLPPFAPPRPPRAQSGVDLLDRCITETGLLPSSRWLVRWCRASAIPVNEADLQPWTETVAQVRALRATRGETTPEAVAVPTDYPPLPEAPGRRRHSREDVLASLRLYGKRHLSAGARPRFKHYQAAAAADRELITASVLGRHGRFQDLCVEAGL